MENQPVEELNSVTITLETTEHVYLYLRVDSTGRFSRLGDASIAQSRGEMVFEDIPRSVYTELIAARPSGIMEEIKEYTLSDGVGLSLRLSIVVEGEKGAMGKIFHYASKSYGPPQEYVNYVRYACQITDPFYENSMH